MRIPHMGKKGVAGLDGLAWSIVILVIIVVIGVVLLANFQTAMASMTEPAINTTITAGITGIGTFNSWYTVIIIIGIAAAIFGMLAFLRGSAGGGGA